MESSDKTYLNTDSTETFINHHEDADKVYKQYRSMMTLTSLFFLARAPMLPEEAMSSLRLSTVSDQISNKKIHRASS